MNYAGIKYCDIANGSGCRTVLFVSGCRNACKGCFQPQTWDFCYGKPFDEAVQQEVIDSLEPEYITGITLLGGEPFEPENQAALLPFMKKVKELGRIAPAHCFQCLKHCNPGTTPYCITQALINAAKGKIDDALLFCGAYAYLSLIHI